MTLGELQKAVEKLLTTHKPETPVHLDTADEVTRKARTICSFTPEAGEDGKFQPTVVLIADVE